MLVVDTSVLVPYLRGEEAVATFLEREAARGEVLVPALAAWELWRGADTPKQRSSVELLLRALRVDPFGSAIARLAGELHLSHRRAGTPRANWDLLIAAHAVHHGCPLATRDIRQGDIEGLDLFPVP